MGLKTKLVEQVAQNWPVELWREVHLVVAVSGGADSVALARCLASLKQTAGGPGQLFLGHFNHRLRGANSEADADFVRELAHELGLEVIVGQAAESSAGSSEEAARDARYRFFRDASASVGARYVATAHTADDQTETLLLRLLRGTGIAGMRGIPVTRLLSHAVTVVRPLLGTTRQEVIAYLSELGQAFREDESNATDVYTRNRLRRLLPQLRSDISESLDQSLASFAKQAEEVQSWLDEQASQLVQECFSQEEECFAPQDKAGQSKAGKSRAGKSRAGQRQITISIASFPPTAPLVVREACKHAWRAAGWPEQAMGYEQWQRLAEVVQADAGKPTSFHLPGEVLVEVRPGDVVRLSRSFDAS